MSIKQKGQHCTDGERGWETGRKTISDVQMLFFLSLREATILRRKYSNTCSDPLQVAGISTKKKDSKTLFLASSAKKKEKV